MIKLPSSPLHKRAPFRIEMWKHTSLSKEIETIVPNISKIPLGAVAWRVPALPKSSGDAAPSHYTASTGTNIHHALID